MRPLPRSPRFVPLLATALAGLLLVGASGVPSYADSDEPVADPVVGSFVDPTADPGTPAISTTALIEKISGSA